MHRYLLTLLIVVFSLPLLQSQAINPVLRIGEVNACKADTAMISFYVNDFTRVVDMLFNLEWNRDSLELLEVIQPYEAELPLSVVYNSNLGRYDFSSSDLITSPLSDAFTIPEGDVFIILKILVHAMSGIHEIENTFHPDLYNTVVFDDSGVLNEADISIQNGGVNLAGGIADLQLELDSIYCGHPEAFLQATAANPAVIFEWLSEGSEAGNGATFSTSESGEYELVASLNENCKERVSFTVAVDTILARPQVQSDTINCGNPQALLSILSPDPDLEYHWLRSNVEVSSAPTYETSLAGDYQLTTRNPVNNCVDTQLVTIELDTLTPAFDVINAGSLGCDAETVTLTLVPAESNYQSSWNGNPEGDLNLTVASPGSYSAQVTNPENECTADTLVMVSEDDAPPALSIGDAEILTCATNSVTLSLATGEPDGSYEWMNEAGNVISTGRTATAAQAGIFSVTMAGQTGTCARTSEVTVVADTTHPEVTTLPLEIDCRQPTVALAYNSSLSGLTAAWTDAMGGTVAGDLATTGGDYFLSVTNPANGCITESILEVFEDFQLPLYDLNQPTTVLLDCRQSSTTALVTYAGDYSIAWSDEPGTIIATTDSVSLAAEGEVLLVVTNNDNGCTDSTRLIVLEEVEGPEVTIDAPEGFNCMEDQLTLSVTSNVATTYEWDHLANGQLSGGNNGEFIVEGAGTLVLTSTALITGCISQDTILLLPAMGDLDFSLISINQQDCTQDRGAEIQLGSGGGGVAPYIFTFGDEAYPAASTITDVAPGTYTLRLEDSEGCGRDTTISVPGFTPFMPMLSGVEGAYFPGDLLRFDLSRALDPNYTYLINWTVGDSVVMGPAEFRGVAGRTADYSVMVLRSDGCTATIDGSYFVDERTRVFSPTVFSPNGDGINDNYTVYPGPEVAQISAFTIYDRWGAEVYRAPEPITNLTPGWDGRVGGEPASIGTYVVSFSYETINNRAGVISETFQLIR